MWLRVFVTIILILLTAPILIIALMSFTSVSYFKFPLPGFSLDWYLSFFGDQAWITSIGRSLVIAAFTTIISVIIGTLAANAVIRIKFYGKKVFMALMLTPLIVPVIIVGIALFRFFSPFQLNGTITGIVLSHSILAIPIVFVTVLASLKGMDKNLELAAMGLGSSPLGAFFKVTLPYLKPALLSGSLFAFLVSFDELIVTIFLAGPTTKTLPVKMWEDLRTEINPTIAAVSTVIIVSVVILYIVQNWFANRSANRS